MLVIVKDYNNNREEYKLNLNESQLELLYYLNGQDIMDISIDIIKEDEFKKFEKEND